MLPSSSPATFCREFSLSEIKSATNNFSVDLIIGKGSFGDVYRATIVTGPGSTTTVAVKRLNLYSKQGPDEFWTEVNLLPTFRHSHVISLIGYCVDRNGNEMILVYEYMANGTLADHIYRSKKNNKNSSYLSWEQRLKICIGVGRGLEYLHTGTGIDQIVIHRDLKSSNILLDADWEAKISDFGLCKAYSGNSSYRPITASVKGTFAYMDPNYRTTHKLSTKTDVYAFGVVLLEVFCGRRALDFKVAESQKCFKDRVIHKIVDRGLWGRISDDGLQIFLDITLKCLQDRPNKRPSMVEVVGKLESALASQYTTYSSSSMDDEYVKIYFGHEFRSSSSVNSDVDPFRHAVEKSKSDTVKQDPGSETSITTVVQRSTRLKSSKDNTLDAPTDEQIDQVKADVSMHIARAYETSSSLPNSEDDECEKLFLRMNPPKVAVDNESCENATVIKIDSTKAQGVLLEVVQVLTDFDLIVSKFSRTSDGLWFIDVFSVIDQDGDKIKDEAKIQNIQEDTRFENIYQHKPTRAEQSLIFCNNCFIIWFLALCVYSSSTSPLRTEDRSFPNNHTTIELIGNDRPGLISEISAILTNLQCNVVSAEVWAHNARTAAVMHVSHKETEAMVTDSEKLSKIKELLMIVLKGGSDNKEAKITVSNGCARFDRRLHQMMHADGDYVRGLTLNDKQRPNVNVHNWYDKDYWVVSVRCKDRPKLLFDTLCTLTDLMYFVFHGNFDTMGPEAYMEFWIRDINGFPVRTYAERQRVIHCLVAAVERRVSEGLKIELRAKDRVGLLCDVTRIIRENSLTITRAEVSTTGNKAVFAFYVNENLGYPVDPKIIKAIGKEIGVKILNVKGHHEDPYQLPQEPLTGSMFNDFLKDFLGLFGFFQTSSISLPGIIRRHYS